MQFHILFPVRTPARSLRYMQEHGSGPPALGHGSPGECSLLVEKYGRKYKCFDENHRCTVVTRFVPAYNNEDGSLLSKSIVSQGTVLNYFLVPVPSITALMIKFIQTRVASSFFVIGIAALLDKRTQYVTTDFFWQPP